MVWVKLDILLDAYIISGEIPYILETQKWLIICTVVLSATRGTYKLYAYAFRPDAIQGIFRLIKEEYMSVIVYTRINHMTRDKH